MCNKRHWNKHKKDEQSQKKNSWMKKKWLSSKERDPNVRTRQKLRERRIWKFIDSDNMHAFFIVWMKLQWRQRWRIFSLKPIGINGIFTKKTLDRSDLNGIRVFNIFFYFNCVLSKSRTHALSIHLSPLLLSFNQ